MTIKEVKEISKLLPVFVQMCENNLGEDEHEIKNPLTFKELEQIENLLSKLNNCMNFVDQGIFQ